VLKLPSTGAPVKRVASQLGITTHAVNKYSTTAYRKLGVANIGTAVVAARRLDLIPSGDHDSATGAHQQIFDSLPAGIYAKDLAGRYTLCNRVAAARFGLTSAEMLGRTAEDIMDKLVPDTANPGATKLVLDTDAGHVRIQPRIAGPRFDAATDGPGVLRVNDIDLAAEDFGNPHFEPADHGQTSVFEVRGDAKSFCLGGLSCAGIVAFGAQGGLPVTWTVKANLAAVDTMRSVSFTAAQFDAWEQGWQDYYCGKGAHPTLPLTPGTNSPDPRGACPAVNPPEARPTTAPQVVVSPTPITIVAPSAPAATPAAPLAKPLAKKATAKQKKAFKRCMAKANKKSGKAKRTARARCARMPH
jgi:hypothetical protein